MTHKKAKELLPALAHFANGGKLWVWCHPFEKWEVQTSIYINDTYPVRNIIEDKHFEARKAFALGEEIQAKKELSKEWRESLNPQWSTYYSYRPKPKPSTREVLITKVCDQIDKDVKMQDFTAIEQLLEGTHNDDLIAYLPEEENK